MVLTKRGKWSRTLWSQTAHTFRHLRMKKMLSRVLTNISESLQHTQTRYDEAYPEFQHLEASKSGGQG